MRPRHDMENCTYALTFSKFLGMRYKTREDFLEKYHAWVIPSEAC